LSETEFNKILLEAIDKGLSSIGDSSKQSIYFHLERVFNINRQEIPDKIADFQDALEKIFGLGAQFLEIIIMKRLHEKIGQPIQLGTADFSFVEYVSAVKRSFLEKKKLRTRHGLIHAAKLRTLLFSRRSDKNG
jgi:hypothetical protein